MSETKELAIQAQGIRLRTVDDVARIARMMAESGYFKDARDAAQAGVKIMAGNGWGIQPFDAMTGIHVIQGKPVIGAGLMAAKVKGSGKYDYRVREMTEKVCTVEFFQGSESLGVSSFTIEEAKAAGTQNLSKFPRNMLFARAISNGVKWFCPDVFSSPVYVPEELGAEVDEQGDVIDVQHRVEPTSEPTEEPAAEGEPVITGKQVQALAIAIGSADFGTDEDGKQQGRAFVSWLAGREEAVGSIKDLTMTEANTVLDRLGSGENGAYRTDAQKLAEAINAWHEHLDLQRAPVPEFDPSPKKAQKVKDMEPIREDEEVVA